MLLDAFLADDPAVSASHHAAKRVVTETVNVRKADGGSAVLILHLGQERETIPRIVRPCKKSDDSINIEHTSA